MRKTVLVTICCSLAFQLFWCQPFLWDPFYHSFCPLSSLPQYFREWLTMLHWCLHSLMRPNKLHSPVQIQLNIFTIHRLDTIGDPIRIIQWTPIENTFKQFILSSFIYANYFRFNFKWNFMITDTLLIKKLAKHNICDAFLFFKFVFLFIFFVSLKKNAINFMHWIMDIFNKLYLFIVWLCVRWLHSIQNCDIFLIIQIHIDIIPSPYQILVCMNMIGLFVMMLRLVLSWSMPRSITGSIGSSFDYFFRCCF